MQCKGFLFDLDGTLVDSLPVVERSWCHWADRHGIDHQDVLNFIHGKQAITSLRHFWRDVLRKRFRRSSAILSRLKLPIPRVSPRCPVRANCLST